MIEIVFSFDTTGSMYPCLAEVRRHIDKASQELFKEIPNLRIGVIAHGDYCDARSTYVTKHLLLTEDANALTYFINNVERTGGGDAPECYELVLHEAQSFNWSPDSNKLLVVMGDEVPHPPAHNPKRLDWREETKKLTQKGILVHGVQCLNRKHATKFYADLADMTGGFHLPLSQFSDAVELIKAVAYQQVSPEALQNYEQTLADTNRITRSLDTVFNKLSRRSPTVSRFKPATTSVDLASFQTVTVEFDQPIQSLVESLGVEFERGCGFYEFTKRETIQAKKKIILMDNESGDKYEDDAAREVLGFPIGSDIKIAPAFGSKYTVFVQSTSSNRKLIGGTRFLYKVK